MKLIIVLLACLVGLGVWVLGCDTVNGFDDNPIVVVGDNIYIDVPCDADTSVLYMYEMVSCRVDVEYDDYTIEYSYRSGRNEIRKVVLSFSDCSFESED